MIDIVFLGLAFIAPISALLIWRSWARRYKRIRKIILEHLRVTDRLVDEKKHALHDDRLSLGELNIYRGQAIALKQVLRVIDRESR